MSDTNQQRINNLHANKLEGWSYPTLGAIKLEPFNRSPATNTVKRKRRRRSMMDDVASSLGLVKVRGSVSGRTYYE